MIITKKITMALDWRGVVPVVDAVQDDSFTRAVEIALTYKGQPWEIPSDTTAAIRFKKPDGKKGLYDTLPNEESAYTISGNVVTVVLAPEVLTAEGRVDAAVALYQGNKVLGLFPFIVSVAPNPASSQSISNNYYYLQTWDDVNAAIRDLEESTSRNIFGLNELYMGLKSRVAELEKAPGGGGTGADGFSPVANVTQTDTGAVIAITDKNGTTTATIANGKDGADSLACNRVLPYPVPVGETTTRMWSELSRTPKVGEVFNALCGTYYTVFEVTEVKGSVYTAKALASTDLSGEPGAVQTVNGIAPDLNGNVEIPIPDSSQNGNGLSDDEKALLLTLFKATQFDADVKATVAQLEVIWTGGSAITYAVQNLLTNASTNNAAETATGGMAYTATLTADDGYALDAVSVTMGGVDVTADVYADGVISILSVSGDIVITATTVNLAIVAPVYSLPEATAFDGTSNIDTGYRLFDTDKDFTVCLDFEQGATKQGSVICEYVNNSFYFSVHFHSSYYWAVQLCGAHGNYNHVGHGGAKYVITHAAGTKTITTSYIVDGAKTTAVQQSSADMTNLIGKTGTLKVGGDTEFSKTGNYFIGTVNALDIYERILDDAEINEFLGV